MTNENRVAFINYSRGKDGTAIASRMYFDSVIELGFHPEWYQFADRFQIQEYMEFPTILAGSSFPIQSLRPGWDRMVYFPKQMDKIKETKIFLSDPTLIRTALGKDFMVKVHDINPLTEYREKWTSWAMFKYAMPRLKSATAVIVTTQHMKGVVSQYVEDPGRTFVVPEPAFLDGVKGDPGKIRSLSVGQKIRLLYVAADRPYKNIKTFLDLAAHFQSEGKLEFEFTLVTKPKDHTRRYFQSLNLRNTKILSQVPDIKEIYSSSDILVYPSLYEGFGRPIVEAMSLGIPVIVNDIEPFKEIVGKDGIRLSNGTIDEFEDSILSLSEKGNYMEYSKRSIEGFNARFSRKIFMERLKEAFSFFMES